MKSKARALRCTAGAVNIVAGIAIIVYRSYPGECEEDVLDAQIIVSVGARSLPDLHCASGCSDLDNEEEFSSRVPLDVYLHSISTLCTKEDPFESVRLLQVLDLD